MWSDALHLHDGKCCKRKLARPYCFASLRANGVHTLHNNASHVAWRKAHLTRSHREKLQIDYMHLHCYPVGVQCESMGSLHGMVETSICTEQQYAKRNEDLISRVVQCYESIASEVVNKH